MSELPSSEGLDPYPATDAPNPTTLSAAKSPYIADDFSTLTVVGDCAASATDPDNAIELELPSVDADGKSDTTATVQLSVMTDGTIGVAGEVKEYMRDANDNWIST